ncbi:S-adenosylmethionine:tRNA ribosyltransferase-isomerase [Emticicia sp. 21SJ11W-3]|uniref:S-adenosylmethionine:tRNA ribosyltransferase-isomerase n=1 Tax=Emticicia sp. 21SJ11W-3 TaxID=2916755 RepID=UPI00209E022D|nr:S-adenosylmethionine:tRNA ribosyltransferase-isomerase [Emticicia sp. 21SJ11W-3]UTA67513.1 S-adenosylmethionine:tRNA ribosyltransferase-isomerase [Emticicia sp. 21SJ11W-3]
MITLDLDKYTYHLPDERIARFPVEPRDVSKLLVYKDSLISEDRFYNLAAHLPKESFLVFNNTKVIPARLYFQKESGALIEIFLLNPVAPSTVISQVMETRDTCTWACMIGNKKRLKGRLTGKYSVHTKDDLELVAELVDNEKNYVQFTWNNPELTFAEIVRFFGQIPLPPYLKRETEEKDYDTYQTVYSKNDGAVAAPTAGLHFTEKVLFDLVTNDIEYDFITLHVGAGTFQPIKVQNVVEHQMHSEQIVFEKDFIKKLLANRAFVIPVGTTSMRSLESLYWFGVKLLEGNETFFIEKLFPYQWQNEVSIEASLQAVLNYMDLKNIEQLIGETEIFIFPGYQFRICKGIITNFHQPDSTLILLVAALVGDNWRTIYDFALENNFRFLSYGDSSLLIP